ncbi:MAG: HlyD family efflux transporter periplasmic adaptor subunit [Blastochloris viridis]|uniref:HlyD family efflux transporter periplasmic adaptor subunit n=1 Tax=Blastochloris viridis TaxID=1079 RepID=A0A6N4RCB9_BLAVI|nr:MAG: HlyD family efflux transporter periplasmic adaptor subunit [Blastochloris viridis]
MKPHTLIFIAIALAVAGSGCWYFKHTDMNAIAPAEGPDHAEADEHGHADEGHGDEASTTLSDEVAKAAGITVETAGPAALAERLPLRGKIILNPETSAEVKARFAGVVKRVRATLGQTVTKGEALATVESNDSLQTYAVTSPLSGVVLARSVNVGDTAAEQPLFTVANLATVTAELHVFPQDISRVRVGQTVQVQSVDGSVEGTGTIKALLPTTDADTQTVQVWVTLPNSDARWRAGMAVQAGAVVGEDQQVALAVKNTALQTLNNQTVVFVKEGETYAAHPIKPGRTDGVMTEVLEGLEAGDSYVATNSFIVKADIGKASAEHSH